jgi:hypothetical protein
MNDGLLSGSGVHPSPGGGVLAFEVASATATYAINPEPTSDTTVKADDGTTVMSVTLSLPLAANVLVRFHARITKSAGKTRLALYDNGVKIAPATTLSTNGVYSWSAPENNIQEILIAFLVRLEGGTHVLDIRHQAALNTATITWGDRILSAKALNDRGVR